MEVTGTIKRIGETQVIGNNGFKKRELILRTEEQYPQFLQIDFLQDKTDVLNNFSVADNVTIAINLRGREWVNPDGETKYFNSINGWRIAKNELSNSLPPLDQTPPDLNSEEEDTPF